MSNDDKRERDDGVEDQDEAEAAAEKARRDQHTITTVITATETTF